MVSVVGGVVSRGATCADASTAPANRPMKSSDRIIVEEVGFWKMYGQLYNRVSAANTPNILKIELSRHPVVFRAPLTSERVATGRLLSRGRRQEDAVADLGVNAVVNELP